MLANQDKLQSLFSDQKYFAMIKKPETKMTVVSYAGLRQVSSRSTTVDEYTTPKEVDQSIPQLRKESS